LPPADAMPAGLLIAVALGYFTLLLAVAWRTSRHASNESFFIGERKSPWALVAFGMVGTSLSGVTFISVPGAVGATGFTYFQIILGHVVGYAVIALVLLPVYYRHRLTSIYNYLGERLGPRSRTTGAAFFIASRTLGATARLYLVIVVLQYAVLDALGVPFAVTAAFILLMILAYTFEGGVKTIVWTDTLQTACMLGGLAVCAHHVLAALDLSVAQSVALMRERGLATMISSDVASRHFFMKDFLAGAFIAIAMTGLDQEMMQKNISVKRLVDSQKNVFALSLAMVAVVLLFLYLGGLLHLYAGDRLFPAIALGHLEPWVQVVFVIALVSALFPSADGAITALTSSMCIDILGMDARADLDEAARKRLRHRVHLAFAAVFLALVMVFKWAASASMISVILTVASYTYGPLLGLFAFGILTSRAVNDAAVPWIALASPLICFAIDANQRVLFGDYEVGLELLIVNGAITFAGLMLASRRAQPAQSHP
jgi:Na+/proline symporter